jgi:hypothetical protein
VSEQLTLERGSLAPLECVPHEGAAELAESRRLDVLEHAEDRVALGRRQCDELCAKVEAVADGSRCGKGVVGAVRDEARDDRAAILGRNRGTRYSRMRPRYGAAGVTERLPELLDAKSLQAELGVTRAAAEAIMRRLPVVQIEGLRKVYVRRSDVMAYLEARTFAKDEVPA